MNLAVACEFRLPPEFELRVHEAIFQQLASEGAVVEYVPRPAEIAEALQVALWSSVLRDEGRDVKFTINLRHGNVPSRVIPLQRPIDFVPAQLATFSMATTPNVSAVHVGPGASGLEIFGIDTAFDPASPVRMEVLAPATVAVKCGAVTVAFVAGNRAELIDLDVYEKYLFVDDQFPVDGHEDHDREHRFLEIARAMHRQAHGGTLLVLGADAAGLEALERAGSVEPHYPLALVFDGLREIHAEEARIFGRLQSTGSGNEARELFSRLREAEVLHSQYISGVTRTTLVDGASVVSHDGALLAFGCKIRLRNSPQIHRRRPTAAPAFTSQLADFGGTRHQAAARFVGTYPGSRAIVSSQDGKMSILNHAAVDEVDCLEHAEWMF